MNTITIMQPYFVPYTGYFRLIDQADTFVLFDCVQYQRRGWIHRNKLHTNYGTLKWLTLPIQKCPQETLIKDVRFTIEAQSEWNHRLETFKHFKPDEYNDLWARIVTLEGTLVDYLEATLKAVSNKLGLSTTWVRSSELNIPHHLKGEERIIEIVKRLNGKRYINAPGGRALYNPNTFSQHDLDLSFLPPFQGSMVSILERILTEDIETIIHSLKSVD